MSRANKDLPASSSRESPAADAAPAPIDLRWQHQTYAPFIAKHPERKPAFRSAAGIELPPALCLKGGENAGGAEGPGEHPYTRGIFPSMYRGRLWTMRQYAGYSSPRDTNERFRFLLASGTTGLSVAFDLPTQIGYDSDHPLAEGEVGRVGVPISTIEDMDLLLRGIPLEEVSISMTINSTAPILLGLLCALARRRGVAWSQLRGTIQNDVLKEYTARGTQRFPVAASLKLAVDVIEFATNELPRFHPISISGYHIREAGATAIEEVGFTLANGIAYLDACRARKLDLAQVGRRLSFFFNAHNQLFEEVAKFRAARRLWAQLCTERFGITDPQACQLRFHTQTGGSTLTAQEPANNIVRVTIQALAAVLGGTQSLHTNGSDEALSLPSAESAKLALRTQQILATEAGVTEVADPLGGCPYVEYLTDAVVTGARALIAEIDAQGGTVKAIENGFVRRRIEASAYHAQVAIDSGEAAPVGVAPGGEIPDAPFRVDPTIETELRAELVRRKRARTGAAHSDALKTLRSAAAVSTQNLLPSIITALEADATLGEVAATLAAEYGEFKDVVS
ncbi:MAG: methylmalonyl-CoA mutase [Planctomycetota bacterium]